MTKVDKVVFLKNPNEVLEQIIKNFIKESEFNRRDPIGPGRLLGGTSCRICIGHGPALLRIQDPHRPLPPDSERDHCLGFKRKRPSPSSLRDRTDQRDLLDPSRSRKRPGRATGRRNDFHPNSGPTREDFGEACNDALRRHVAAFLENMGHIAVAPVLLPSFQASPG